MKRGLDGPIRERLASYAMSRVSAESCAVRVFARWVDDPRECPFAFDLILERGSNRIIGAWQAFGATDLDGPARRPFVLDATGVLDFGTSDRCWRTDLRLRPVVVGGRFLVWWTEEDYADYEIVKVAVLGGKMQGRPSGPPRPDG